MEFDRKGPEGGLEIYSAMENGKAFLEFKVHLRQSAMEELLAEAGDAKDTFFKTGYLDIRVWDAEGNPVLYCRHLLNREELPGGLLVHPRLWQGTQDPYLYHIRAALMASQESVVDVLEDSFAIRSFREIPGKGWLLNDASFEIRAVGYHIPGSGKSARSGRIRMRHDLEWIRRMGANTICPLTGEIDREFCRLCDEAGLVVWWGNPLQENGSGCEEEQLPVFYGTKKSLLSMKSRFPTDRYYFYKAKWGSEPFVYISEQSLRFQKNGNATVTVYSNRKKVALYVQGALFEFRSEGPEFVFHEIPVKKLPLQLAAEAEECNMSLTACPFTECSQNNHQSMTFTTYNNVSEEEHA